MLLSNLVTPSRQFAKSVLNESMNINEENIKYHPFYRTYTEYNQQFSPFMEQHSNPATQTTSYKYIEGNRNALSDYRYAAFTPGEPYLALMSNISLEYMSKMITGYLKGVHPEGKNIIVPQSTIESIADSIYMNENSDVQTMQQMVINLVSNKIREEYDQVITNNKLDAYVQNYDGTYGIKQFSGVKLNNRGMNWNTNMAWKY